MKKPSCGGYKPGWIANNLTSLSLSLPAFSRCPLAELRQKTANWGPREMQVAGVSLCHVEQIWGSKQNKQYKADAIPGASPGARRVIGYHKCLLEKQINPLRRVLVEYDLSAISIPSAGKQDDHDNSLCLQLFQYSTFPCVCASFSHWRTETEGFCGRIR